MIPLLLSAIYLKHTPVAILGVTPKDMDIVPHALVCDSAGALAWVRMQHLRVVLRESSHGIIDRPLRQVIEDADFVLRSEGFVPKVLWEAGV